MVETLVVVSQHRSHQYSCKSRGYGPATFRSFGSSPCRGEFTDTNCRGFQSVAGLLPTPIRGHTTPVTKQGISPKTPSPSINSRYHSEEATRSKHFVKSGSIPIPISIKADTYESFYSERWAGPTYSNSPPPSSLPIPKFSRPTRTGSLDLASSSAPNVDLFPIAKSAPATPTRNYNNPFAQNPFEGDDSATKTLRRILNLEPADK